MKKEYKYVPGSSGESDSPDENGITDSMLDFSWDRNVEISVSRAGTIQKEIVSNDFYVIYSSPPKLTGRIQRKR